MQHKISEYNPEVHNMFVCLSIKEPYATMIAEGKKTIELRSRKTKYRGLVIICSTKSTVSGTTVAITELYDCKNTSELTPEEWNMTGIPEENRQKWAKTTAWMLRNTNRVTQVPVKGQLGLYRLILDIGDLKFEE